LHLIDRWRLVGTVNSEEALHARLADGPSDRPFDPDIYRIISRFLQAGKIGIRVPARFLTLSGAPAAVPARPPALRNSSAMSVFSVFSAQSTAVAPLSLAMFGSA
jgi:hypothetical protein